jgi:hypothetical protein
MSSSEPKWMQSIPNDFVCNYFWAFSAIILIAGLITVAGFIYLLLTTPKMRGLFSILLMTAILKYGLIFFLYVCLYLTCSRSLLNKKQ